MGSKIGRARQIGRVFCAIAAAMLIAAPAPLFAQEPIKIGFSMELTGPFAVVGKTGLLAFKIWEEEINAKGGLLGRPVKLVYYDDQSNPSNVPAIYTKLIDIDKVDLLISSYGTNLVVPAMPVAISHNRLFFGLFALAANDKFHYPKYFSMLPFGPEPVKTFAEGYFDLAAAQNPKPKTVAIVATDAEFQHKAAESARGHAKRTGIEIVYDRAYPPTTVDFTPIVRAIQAAQPDMVGRRSRAEDQHAGRRACRASGGGDQDAAGRGDQRPHQHRSLGAGQDDGISRRHGFSQDVSGKGAR
jgi:branched-chain amino acid transport system substrate-binding protein